MGIFEIFVIDDEARKLIYEKVPSSVLRARAREMGMRTLREDGVAQSAGRPDHARMKSSAPPWATWIEPRTGFQRRGLRFDVGHR